MRDINLAGTVRSAPRSRAKALVARSTDKDELTTEWIAIDESDFAAQRSLFQQMLAAAVAKQDAEVEQIADRLDSMPDHSSAEARYLTSYGLTECAKLETM